MKRQIDRLMRTPGFPFIQTYINKYDGNGDVIKPLLTIEITKFIKDKGLEDKGLKDFLDIIQKDFFKKGIVREKLVEESIKIAHPEMMVKRDVSYEGEYNGIDILALHESGDKEQGCMAVSVKGPKFDQSDEFKAHGDKLVQLKKNKPHLNVYVAFTDEKTEDIRVRRVK